MLAQQKQNNAQRMRKRQQQVPDVVVATLHAHRFTDALLACFGDNGVALTRQSERGCLPPISDKEIHTVPVSEQKGLAQTVLQVPSSFSAEEGVIPPSQNDVAERKNRGVLPEHQPMSVQPGQLGALQGGQCMAGSETGENMKATQQMPLHAEIPLRSADNTVVDLAHKTIKIDCQASQAEVHYSVTDNALARVVVTKRIVAPSSENMRLNSLLGQTMLPSPNQEWHFQNGKFVRSNGFSPAGSILKRENEAETKHEA
jgi:hypothetical protein